MLSTETMRDYLLGIRKRVNEALGELDMIQSGDLTLDEIEQGIVAAFTSAGIAEWQVTQVRKELERRLK